MVHLLLLALTKVYIRILHGAILAQVQNSDLDPGQKTADLLGPSLGHSRHRGDPKHINATQKPKAIGERAQG